MRQRYLFNHDHYYHTLKNQIGGDIPVFHGVRQRGGGLGSVLGSFARFAIPLINKYIMPHVKNAAISTIEDIAANKPIKSALKKNSLNFLNNVKDSVLNKSQTGKGLKTKKVGKKKINKRRKNIKKASRKKSKKKRKKVSRKKQDFFT